MVTNKDKPTNASAPPARDSSVVSVGILLFLLVVALVVMAVRTFTSRGTDPATAFQLDLDAYQKIDPALLKYDVEQTLVPPVDAPRAIAAGPGDRLYVAGDGKIVVYDSAGAIAETLSVPFAPRAIAVGEDKTVFAALENHVEVVGADGEIKAAWQNLGEQAILTSIAVAADSVFVADAGQRMVFVFDRSGTLTGRIGRRDQHEKTGGFVIPSPHFDLALDPYAGLWVVNPGKHALQNYGKEGELLNSWSKSSVGIEGFCGCCNPTDIAILSNGWFVTSEKGLVRVKVYDPVGRFQGVVAGPELFEENVASLDLAVLGNRIVVLDPKAEKITVFQPKEQDDE